MRTNLRTRLDARALTLALAPSLLALACGSSGDTATRDAGATPDVATTTDVTSGDGGAGLSVSCVYRNPFSMRDECREYVGPDWSEEAARRDCTLSSGTLRTNMACTYPSVLGRCLVNGLADNATRLTFPGDSAAQCQSTQTGCTVFARGAFTPDGVCVAALGGDGGTVTADASVPDGGFTGFRQPTRTCRDPLPGQAPGQGPGGQVCTWNAISAATEAGRRFDDYASCETVRSQRPYYPVPAAPARTTTDPRLSDPTYTAELAWVRGQIEASACVCCHSSRVAPSGTSNWYVEAPGNWMDSFFPSGLALGAGWIDSTVFGAYPAEQNNGFSRTTSGFPSTDPARMARFFAAELASRGMDRAMFATARPFGGPLYDQLVYTPTACAMGEGVSADGTVRWQGGVARYVYVLDQGSANPGVPPNLDLPTGTRWRVDVPATGAPLASGITYGRTPDGATQRFPATGAPAALARGATYYLYVLADVGVPITRCTFTAP